MSSDRQMVADAARNANSPDPASEKHLFYLIHGLFGKEEHMKVMHAAFEAQLPADSCIVYSSKCSETLKTLEGIELCALRVFQELIRVIEENSITQLSIIGYSQGGLVGRYIVGLLEEMKAFRIVKPMNFITVATPHLGTLFWDGTRRTKFLNTMGKLLLGPAGTEFFSYGPDGILDQLADENSAYMIGLNRFSNLMLYCNAIGDRTVNFWTSYISDRSPFGNRTLNDLELVFFTYEENKHGPFLVDMNNSKFTAHPKGRVVVNNTKIPAIFYAIGPIILTIATVITHINSLFKKWPLRLKVRHLMARGIQYRNLPSGEGTPATSSTGKSGSEESEDLGGELHQAFEDAAPVDESDDASELSPWKSFELNPDDQTPVLSDRLPEPVDSTADNIVDQCPVAKSFNGAVKLRLMQLNKLPWKKYVFYSHHYRTHASIIDRLHEGDHKGNELLRFMAQNVLLS